MSGKTQIIHETIGAKINLIFIRIYLSKVEKGVLDKVQVKNKEFVFQTSDLKYSE